MLKTKPFPHIIVDGMFSNEGLENVLAEFPNPDDARLRRYGNQKENKLEGPEPTWGPRTRDYFDAVRSMIPALEDIFKLENLTMETIGGGYHIIPPGGYLGVHTDFNRSPDTQLYRRLNFLTFLNHDWGQGEGGFLVMHGDGGEDRIELAPEFGRTVVFETSDHSWHGHPAPTTRWRYSVAAYFFTPDPPEGYTTEHSTVWFD